MTVINGNPTNFSNLIEPTVFLDWIYRQNTQTNRFVQSGVLKNDPVLGGRLLQPGRSVEIPAMNDLSGDADEWNDADPLLEQVLKKLSLLGELTKDVQL